MKSNKAIIVTVYTAIGFVAAEMFLYLFGARDLLDPITTNVALGFVAIMAIFVWVGGAVANTASTAGDPREALWFNFPVTLRSLFTGLLFVVSLLAVTAILLQAGWTELASVPILAFCVIVTIRSRSDC